MSDDHERKREGASGTRTRGAAEAAGPEHVDADYNLTPIDIEQALAGEMHKDVPREPRRNPSPPQREPSAAPPKQSGSLTVVVSASALVALGAIGAAVAVQNSNGRELEETAAPVATPAPSTPGERPTEAVAPSPSVEREGESPAHLGTAITALWNTLDQLSDIETPGQAAEACIRWGGLAEGNPDGEMECEPREQGPIKRWVFTQRDGATALMVVTRELASSGDPSEMQRAVLETRDVRPDLPWDEPNILANSILMRLMTRADEDDPPDEMHLIMGMGGSEWGLGLVRITGDLQRWGEAEGARHRNRWGGSDLP